MRVVRARDAYVVKEKETGRRPPVYLPPARTETPRFGDMVGSLLVRARVRRVLVPDSTSGTITRGSSLVYRGRDTALCRNFPDGETRTRTGDTTIFRQR